MTLKLGATYIGGGRCKFLVWAPLAESVEVRILDQPDPATPNWSILGPSQSAGRLVRLRKQAGGYHQGIIDGVEPGTRYSYRLDGKKDRPDPASRFQPAGVHGPSQVVDPPAFRWNDATWLGLPLEDYILYEVHVGTYTAEGTFDAIIPHLEEIKDLGATALELMPVAQFPGDRNWGYDGAYPFAVQNNYGGPEGLNGLVDACHRRGLAVVLDVVYNHLGPEGNYLNDFGPYFTDQYRVPWGQAVNFDGPYSDKVVQFFTENALYWICDHHIDALRLDAIHGIVDRNAHPFLELLAGTVHKVARETGRQIYLIAESNLNDARFIRPEGSGGYGLDAQWNDDFHHALHTLLTPERTGYYQDFGRVGHLKKALEEGFVYSGQYSAYRRCRHGNSSCDIPARQFVVFAQNHDQVGNRLLGDRLSTVVSFEALKLAAGMVILSPYVPLLFMGEEWGELAPFQYFTSHSDAGLIEAVRRGRREEFTSFRWEGEPPDPQDESTFRRSRLNLRLRHSEPHRTLLDFYQELIELRKTLPGLAQPSKEHLEVRASEPDGTLQIRRWSDSGEALIVANFADEPNNLHLTIPTGNWRIVVDSADCRWRGPGSVVPESFESGGEARLRLLPKSFLVLGRL